MTDKKLSLSIDFAKYHIHLKIDKSPIQLANTFQNYNLTPQQFAKLSILLQSNKQYLNDPLFTCISSNQLHAELSSKLRPNYSQQNKWSCLVLWGYMIVVRLNRNRFYEKAKELNRHIIRICKIWHHQFIKNERFHQGQHNQMEKQGWICFKAAQFSSKYQECKEAFLLKIMATNRYLQLKQRLTEELKCLLQLVSIQKRNKQQTQIEGIETANFYLPHTPQTGLPRSIYQFSSEQHMIVSKMEQYSELMQQQPIEQSEVENSQQGQQREQQQNHCGRSH